MPVEIASPGNHPPCSAEKQQGVTWDRSELHCTGHRTPRVAPQRLFANIIFSRLGWLAIIVPIMLGGCGGCQKTSLDDQQTQQENSKDEEETSEFSIGDFETFATGETVKRNFVKPGHFVAATIPVTANKFDFQGELETATVDSSRQPTLITDTRFSVAVSRPASLPKGQKKYLESIYYIPRDTGRGSKTIFLQHRLQAADSDRTVHETSHVTSRMPPYQYMLVVLASDPEAYSYLKQLPSVSPPYDETFDSYGQLLYYQVARPDISQHVPVPSHPLAWTNIAYLVWDGLHPDILSENQQLALLKWLHWGGQLIVSGPGSVELLHGSFLEPYLPASQADAIPLDQEAFAELNRGWSLPRRATGERLTLQVTEDQPLLGLQFPENAAKHQVPGTGGLVLEQTIGRGRIAVTAFSLSSREVVNWGSYDSFFNGCLLRRPPRNFSARQFLAPQMTWSGVAAARDDARLTTQTRYFSRDVASPATSETASESETAANRANAWEQWCLQGYHSDPDSGVAGWVDGSGAGLEAQKALRDAAGITIPQASFVWRAMAVYLFFLIPVNWGFFRLLGRVEWAWFAVPVLAILGAIVVIRQAQLDIGFARSRTEVAILEIQGSFDRGHLTRYTALYNSLASGYELRFDDPRAVARPMQGTSSPDRLWQMVFRREADARLSRFQVVSNTTGFVHSEQMLDLGGGLRLVGTGPADWRLVNQSKFHFQNVGLLHRTEEGQLLVCWLESLQPGRGAKLPFRPAGKDGPWLSEWQSQQITTEQSDELADTVDLTGLLRLAARQLPIRPGDLRMIGWTDDQLPGLTVHPTAPQALSRALVIAHLKYGPLPAAKPDDNLLVDVQRKADADNLDDNSDDEMEQSPQDEDAANKAANPDQP